MPHSEPVAAAPSGDWERFEFGKPEWLLELGAASRSVPSRRGWRAARARRQLAREALAAKVTPSAGEEPTGPAEAPATAEPEEVVPTLLERISVYTVKPSGVNLH
jgi:hypothetical protein